MTDAQTLAAVTAAQERTRRARRAGWIPLLVFGLSVLPALLFHLQSRTVLGRGDDGVLRRVTETYANTDGGQGLFWYWELVIPLGYFFVAALYTVRNRRAGVRTTVTTYVVTGIALMVAVYLLASSAAPLGLSNFGTHGMEATVTIGLALFVLAWLERNATLAGCAAIVTGVAVAASQYDLENLWAAGTPAWLGAATNDLVLTVALLASAAVVALIDRTRARAAAAG